MLEMLLNTKAAASAAAGLFGSDAPSTLVSGQSPVDGRGWLDGSGWTVSTGSSKASGATISKTSAADPMVGGTSSPSSPISQAGGWMVGVMVLVAGGAWLWNSRS